ncbi:MAG: superoxide dismutase [Flavobacteriales bacterium]|nr:superoxide dismutase [Flavobacteriales bacterium]|tara:strand:- start:156 stop:746 length:591 start_codon:yes stop_codon:yes gene_type:complete
MAFNLPDLKYEYNSLEPHFDAKTMEIHHSKHHAGYTNNLNNAIKETNYENMSIEDILKSSDLPVGIRNNGGGFYNHCLFWSILSPNGGGEPEGKLIEAINRDFGSFENMKSEFNKAAATRFGSGWAWLCFDNGMLSICSTANQDNPLMDGQCGGTPIMGLDVWEHAYYLNYQNRRPDYINAFWSLVDWNAVENLMS